MTKPNRIILNSGRHRNSERKKTMVMRITHFYGGRGSVEILYAIILVGGFFWCREIFRRLPEDISTFKQGADRPEKWGTIIYWALTAGIMALMGYSAWALTVKVIGFVK